MSWNVEMHLADGTFHVESFGDRWAAECYLSGLSRGWWNGKAVTSARLIEWAFS